jgi:hypothetical protein
MTVKGQVQGVTKESSHVNEVSALDMGGQGDGVSVGVGSYLLLLDFEDSETRFEEHPASRSLE